MTSGEDSENTDGVEARKLTNIYESRLIIMEEDT